MRIITILIPVIFTFCTVVYTLWLLSNSENKLLPSKSKKMKAFIIGIIIILGINAAYHVAWFMSKEEITVTVTNTERINNDRSSKYLVFTKEETFKNTDIFLLGKWNSSDIQGGLEAGKKYTIVVYGWRIPFFSMYRNIYEIKE